MSFLNAVVWTAIILSLVAIDPVTDALHAAPTASAMRKKLERIEEKSDKLRRGRLSKMESLRFQSELKELEQSPKTTAPLLVDDLVNRKKDKSFRHLCFGVLSKKGMLPHITPADYAKIEKVVHNQKDHPQIRIHAANLILRGHKRRSLSTSRTIKKMALTFLKSRQSKGAVRRQIVRYFRGDKEIEDFMLSELNSTHGNDKNGSIAALGKMKCSRAVEPIAAMLASPEADKSFYKTRGYLALGDIGGSRAYDHLIRFLQTEESETERSMILRAIGRSKDPRAKALLLEYLLKSPRKNHVTALAGLKYLGDPSVIPILESELNKSRNAYERNRLEDAIDALRRGDDSTSW